MTALPYSIRCLKSIEHLIGGRDVLAKKLGVSKNTVDRWVIERQIPRAHILPLVKLSNEKFTCEELLGGNDDEQCDTDRVAIN